MTGATRRKDHPLSMRLPDADVAVIDRAAALHGRSRTDFVRDAAVRAAEQAIMETVVIRMGDEGFTSFMEAVSAPGRPVPELVELLGRAAPWDAGR